METTVQILRILGNLCYDCPDGRAQLLGSKCLEHVLAVARDRQGNGKEGGRAKGGDPGQRFPVILPVRVEYTGARMLDQHRNRSKIESTGSCVP